MTSEIKIIELRTQEEMLGNFHLLKQLTSSLTELKYQQYLQQMLPHNYFQIVAQIEDKTVGISGYWIATKLYCGKYLEIDNFIVDEAYRSQKVGYKLIKKIEAIAQHHQCDVMMLDAYLQNTQAHKFYERHDFKARGFHFIKKMTTAESSHECME